MTLHVLTHRRPESADRLIASLRDAHYPPKASVDLEIHVDCDGLLNPPNWPFGNLTIQRSSKCLGLLGQWINAWRPSENDGDESVHVVLEDDLEVSPHFATWFLDGHAALKSAYADEVVAVTGQRPQLRAKGEGTMADAIELLPRKPRAVLYRLMATWSWSPTKSAWIEFLKWFDERRAQVHYVPRVPGIVPDQWYQEFYQKGQHDARMWEMWVIAWMAERAPTSYVLYAWPDQKKTLVGNHRERGQNYDGSTKGLDHPLWDAVQKWTMPPWEEIPRLDWDGLPFKITAYPDASATRK